MKQQCLETRRSTNANKKMKVTLACSIISADLLVTWAGATLLALRFTAPLRRPTRTMPAVGSMAADSPAHHVTKHRFGTHIATSTTRTAITKVTSAGIGSMSDAAASQHTIVCVSSFLHAGTLLRRPRKYNRVSRSQTRSRKEDEGKQSSQQRITARDGCG